MKRMSPKSKIAIILLLAMLVSMILVLRQTEYRHKITISEISAPNRKLAHAIGAAVIKANLELPKANNQFFFVDEFNNEWNVWSYPLRREGEEIIAMQDWWGGRIHFQKSNCKITQFGVTSTYREVERENDIGWSPDVILIPNEELALEIGRLILIYNYPVIERGHSLEVLDKGKCWVVHSYIPNNRSGIETWVKFKKSDCEIINLSCRFPMMTLIDNQ